MKEKTTDTNGSEFGAWTQDSNARLNIPVTLYRGIHPTPQSHITLHDLFAEMVSEDLEKISFSQILVDSYKQHLGEQEKGTKDAKKLYEEKKSQLKGFSVGEFSYRNDKKENCKQYVPCFVFDLDGCKSTEEASLLLQKIRILPYVFAAFPSPSGHGLRIFVWVSATYENHRTQYMQVLKSLCNDLGVTMDKKKGVHFDSTCQNESRFFYYTSVDKKDFYLNRESVLFETPLPKDIFNKNNIKETIDVNELMSRLDAQLKGYFEGRNDRLFHLAMRFKNNDVSLTDAESYATKFVESDFSMKEISTTLKSAYKIAKVQYTEEQKERFLGEKEDKMPPTTNATVENIEKKRVLDLEKKYPSSAFYDRLPPILKQCTDALTHEMDKHVFLWGAFPAISSICCDVSGIYDKKKVYSCYYAYIVATGGAGKGALDYARQLVLGVAQKLQEENEKRTLFVPTNIGNTQLVQKLHDNGGKGLFFETEGGIVAKMSKSENMDLSDTLRKGFHHEMLLLARKMDKLDIAIHELRLSVVISGTFSQLLPTIKEGEDGLFSRFNYLYLTGNYEFKNVFDRQNSENVRRIFAETSQKMVLLFELLQNRTITFEFTEEQEKAFLLFFTEQKNEMMNHLSDIGEGSREIFSGAMNRIGLMCFRAAMILTVLRSFEEGHLEKKEENTDEKVLICNENDFQTALVFAELARNNAFAVFERLPTPKIQSVHKKEAAFNLKAAFKAEQRKLAIELQKEGKSIAYIARLVLGDEKLKGTIHRWLQ